MYFAMKVFVIWFLLVQFSFGQQIRQALSVPPDSPITGENKWNMEVLLFGYRELPRDQIDLETSRKIKAILSEHQQGRRKAIDSIDTELTSAAKAFRKWEIEQEFSRELENRVAKELSSDLVGKLKKRSLQKYLDKHFISRVILDAELAGLSKEQRMELAREDQAIKQRYAEALEKIRVKEANALFEKLSKSQRQKLWELLGSKKNLEVQLKKFPSMTTMMPMDFSRGYFQGMGDTSFEGVADYSSLLINTKIRKKLDISDSQKNDYMKEFFQFRAIFNRMILAGKHGQAKDLAAKHTKAIESIFLKHQIKILKENFCLSLLMRSPMNFLDTKYIKGELEIDDDQLADLIEDYKKIKSNGDKELKTLKANLEKQALKTLTAKQRKSVSELLKLSENDR